MQWYEVKSAASMSDAAMWARMASRRRRISGAVKVGATGWPLPV